MHPDFSKLDLIHYQLSIDTHGWLIAIAEDFKLITGSIN